MDTVKGIGLDFGLELRFRLGLGLMLGLGLWWGWVRSKDRGELTYWWKYCLWFLIVPSSCQWELQFLAVWSRNHCFEWSDWSSSDWSMQMPLELCVVAVTGWGMPSPIGGIGFGALSLSLSGESGADPCRLLPGAQCVCERPRASCVCCCSDLNPGSH